MYFRRCADSTRDHIIEIFRSISPDEYVRLAVLLEAIGEVGWLEWKIDNDEDTLAYLRASPSQRRKKRRWQHPDTIVLLKYNAYGEANRAYSFFYAITVNDFPSAASYRELTSRAVHTVDALRLTHFPRWPFETAPPSWLQEPFDHFGDDVLWY
jgi:hypothetical protein